MTHAARPSGRGIAALPPGAAIICRTRSVCVTFFGISALMNRRLDGITNPQQADARDETSSSARADASTKTFAPGHIQAHSGQTAALSVRELEVLHWCAIGKSSWEIARILGVCQSTVNFHLQNAAKKLRTRGRRAACVAAIARGIIKIQCFEDENDGGRNSS